MAKFGSAVADAKPPYTTSLAHFMEGVQELSYPIEVYKDDFYRVINAHREHWQALRDGWTEEKDLDVDYKPMSAHPTNIAKAQQQQQKLRADEAAKAAAAAGSGMVRLSDVNAMIQAALLAQPSSKPLEEEV